MSGEIPNFGIISSGLVAEHIRGRNIQPLTKEAFLTELEGLQYPQRLIKAFHKVNRELFVPGGVPSNYVYANCSWPLSESGYYDITISDPFIVAEMTKLLSPQPGNRVFEIGAGSGYQAAILAELVGPGGTVLTTEIDGNAARFAQKNLLKAGVTGVEVIQVGDEDTGYQNVNPYDRILVTCSVPPIKNHPLFDQLAKGGRLVIPLGGFPVGGIPSTNACALIAVDKDGDGRLKGQFGSDQAMGFVEMKGRYGWDGKSDFRNPLTLLSTLKKILEDLQIT